MSWLIEAYYGQTEAEIILDEAVLQEMHFSKKDLQDPKTIEKIIRRKEKFETLAKYINVTLDILGVLLSIGLGVVLHSVIAALVALMLVALGLLYITVAIQDMPQRHYDKNVDKYKRLIKEFKEKTQKAIDNTDDPKKKEKMKQIIANCNKVEAEFVRRDKEKVSKELSELIDFCKTLFPTTIEWYKNPGAHIPYGHTGTFNKGYEFIILKELGVSESKIIEYIFKKCPDKVEIGKDLFNKYFGYEGDDFNDFPSLKQIANDHCIWFSSDDDFSRIISKEKKKCYYDCADGAATDSIFDLIKIANFEYDLASKQFKKALIEADKELGYYLFSKCPEGIMQKEWPVKL